MDLRSLGRVALVGGLEQMVEVEASEDLQPRVRTEVHDGVLVVGLRWWLGALLRVRELGEVVVRITTPELRGVRLSGAGQVRREGTLKVENLDLRLSGAGRLTLDLQTRRVRIKTSGAGDCRVHASEDLEAEVSGAGSVRYLGRPRLESRISGAGKVTPLDQSSLSRLPPAEAEAFLRSNDPGRRALLVEQLFAREEFADQGSLLWCDLLRMKSEFPINLWPNAVQADHRWIRP